MMSQTGFARTSSQATGPRSEKSQAWLKLTTSRSSPRPDVITRLNSLIVPHDVKSDSNLDSSEGNGRRRFSAYTPGSRIFTIIPAPVFPLRPEEIIRNKRSRRGLRLWQGWTACARQLGPRRSGYRATRAHLIGLFFCQSRAEVILGVQTSLLSLFGLSFSGFLL